MRTFNKYLNIVNIVMIIIIVIMTFNYQIFEMYKTNAIILGISLAVIEVTNIICSIINFVKKNKLIAIFFLIIGIIGIACFILVMLENEDLYIPIIILGIIAFVLHIVNLIFSIRMDKQKTNVVILIISILIIVAEIIVFSIPFVINSINIANFEKALPIIENDKNIKTYIAQVGYKDYIFIDENGEIIANNEFDDIEISKGMFSVNNKIMYYNFGKNNNKAVLVNSSGDIVFTYSNGNIYNLMYFIGYLEKTNRFGIKNEVNRDKKIITSYNALEKYDETNKKFEDKSNYKYMYFRDIKISNKVLQVVIKDEKETDKKLIKEYAKDERELVRILRGFYNLYDRNYDEIDKFYQEKREYYLIDFYKDEKIKLECNNLIYEVIGSDEENNKIERILLFSNGNIPFYDENENGYFNILDGNKVVVTNSFLITDVNDKYIIVLNKNTGKTSILSVETGQIIKEMNNIIKEIYKQFYVSYPNNENGKYELLDKDFKVLAISDYEPEICENNIILVKTEDETIIYYYNDKEIKKIYETNYWRVKAYSVEMNNNSNNISLYTHLEMIDSEEEIDLIN